MSLICTGMTEILPAPFAFFFFFCFFFFNCLVLLLFVWGLLGGFLLVCLVLFVCFIFVLDFFHLDVLVLVDNRKPEIEGYLCHLHASIFVLYIMSFPSSCISEYNQSELNLFKVKPQERYLLEI